SLVNRRSNENFFGTNYTLELFHGGGQTPLAIDESSIEHIAGARVVRVGNFVGVVAPTEWGAVRAAAELKVTWDEPASPPPGNGNLAGALRTTATETSVLIPEGGDTLLITEMGDVATGLASAEKTVSATYRTSYLLHGPIGPHVAVADVTPAGATIMHQ